MERTRDLACLGGNHAVTQSMHLGTKKKLEYNKFYILIRLILSSCSYAFLYDLIRLSIIIALQASNEAYRNIKCPYRRISPRQNDNSIFSVLCISLLITSVALSWTVDLILLSGDVHPNPGPDSVTSLADLSVSNSVNSFSALANHLSIMHLNIQSILPKLDLIKCESLAYDVLVFSESWLKPVTAMINYLLKRFIRRSEQTGSVVLAGELSFTLDSVSYVNVEMIWKLTTWKPSG